MQNVHHLAADWEARMMDALDRAILRRLHQDGRQTNRDLAEAVGVAPSTALERTRALRARGVITGVHAAVDPVALGRSVQALVGVRIRPQSRETIESVRDSVAKMPETLGVFVVTGNEDILIHVAVPGSTAWAWSWRSWPRFATRSTPCRPSGSRRTAPR